MEACPGLYCGRTLDISNLANCGSCPRGFRVNESSPLSICVPCDEDLCKYDWLFLGTMALASLLAHLFAINFSWIEGQSKLFSGLSYLSAILETFLAALISLLLFDPAGSLDLKFCGVKRLSDWYTLFCNPRKPDYISTVHCTQEAVYPLYTIVLTYYLFSLIMFLLLRLAITLKFSAHKSGSTPLFFGLYALPILVIAHTVLGGLLYYSYPYVLLFGTLWATAAVMNCSCIETPKKLIQSRETMCILLLHCLLYGYSIAAITKGADIELSGLYFILVPVPIVFYMLTAVFTNPNTFVPVP